MSEAIDDFDFFEPDYEEGDLQTTPQQTLQRSESTSTLNSEFSIIQEAVEDMDLVCTDEVGEEEIETVESRKETETMEPNQKRVFEEIEPDLSLLKKEELADKPAEEEDEDLLEKRLVLDGIEASAVARMLEESKEAWTNFATKRSTTERFGDMEGDIFKPDQTVQETMTALFVQLERNGAQLKGFNESFKENTHRLQEVLVQKRHLTKKIGQLEVVDAELADMYLTTGKKLLTMEKRMEHMEATNKELADMFLSHTKEINLLEDRVVKLKNEKKSLERQLWTTENRLDWTERQTKDLIRKVENLEEVAWQKEEQEAVKRTRFRRQQREVNRFESGQPPKPFGRLPVDSRLEPVLTEPEKAFLNNQFFLHDPEDGIWRRYRDLAKRNRSIARLRILLAETCGALARTADKQKKDELEVKRVALREVLRMREQQRF